MSNPTDLITGKPQSDSDDEPVRQATEARLLAMGYSPQDISVDATRTLGPEQDSLRVLADLLVHSQGRPALLLRCARGSLVTREKEALAAARLISPNLTPLTVVTNGEDAELLDTVDGKVLATGLTAIPAPGELQCLLAQRPLQEPTAQQITQAARVYAAYSGFHCEAYCR
ncbi:MAG: type I restriction enzyme HsdR N-terminal domain-containing protein [Desulfarculaceae bacterium]|nr:type I restriction enzyme HsdR N-terminal domain-containing protein [Desulfarculaceae bacterium]MCF8048447.1 type I restriction enzyme HsdR N-terminal domain-containing protein [Desulfarculaceae bacterium]MCF8066481.1 type I restriction enzyme HsdR N-terminal domain-containing protein [Desulfarculaceae bacterium]MCF8096236.1 type I restriction enzyme HsdR N-terminal domain-containing protein [Desulfarculaceae bacterium]MCF8123602.1 type I restriction enzyme HsdR N-terminal domain-containing 